MTDRQENRISSWLARDGFFKLPEINAIWSADLDFAPLVTHFRGTLTEILAIQAIQEKDNTGVAIVKSELRTSLENAIMKVVRAAVAHALLINDPDLLTSVDYSKSDISEARDSALLGIATVVYDCAWPIRVALATRHITEADITLVNTLRDQFLEIIPAPRNSLVSSMTATLELKNKMAEMDSHLKRMDRIILMFEAAHPDFILKYNHVCEIIDLGVRHKKQKSSRIAGNVSLCNNPHQLQISAC